MKLAPGLLLNMVARMTVALMGESPWAVDRMFECWLSDGIAVNHSDLIVLVRDTPPVMWLFSPFDSRPLGKELPGLLNACSCPERKILDDGVTEGKKRKVWVVKHDAHDKKMLRDVKVSISCSVCKQKWPLPSEHLAGQLRKVNGLYAAVVPYFARV